MKNTLKYAALLVGLPFLMGWLLGSGTLEDGGIIREWLGAFSQAVLQSEPTTSLILLAVSWSVVGILFFLLRSKRKAPSPFSRI